MYYELLSYLKDSGLSDQKISQIDSFVFKKHCFKAKEMTHFSKEERKKFDFDLSVLRVCDIVESIDSSKFIFTTSDGQVVEGVLLLHKNRVTFCVSTQVNCPLGCAFCATGKLGFKRNLSYWEIVFQVLLAEKVKNVRVKNVVFMGMGEPFLNYDEVMRAISVFREKLGIGARHITVSTAGIVPKIYSFADLKTQVRLAISLHASYNELRNELMPINRKYDLDALMKAVLYYVNKTNRRVTFEYLLLRGVNDSLDDANKLVRLVRCIKCFVNLIPFNEFRGSSFKRPGRSSVTRFRKFLESWGISVAVRRSLGSEVGGACGQLGSKFS